MLSLPIIELAVAVYHGWLLSLPVIVVYHGGYYLLVSTLVAVHHQLMLTDTGQSLSLSVSWSIIMVAGLLSVVVSWSVIIVTSQSFVGWSLLSKLWLSESDVRKKNGGLIPIKPTR
jgi:hypothetical protein